MTLLPGAGGGKGLGGGKGAGEQRGVAVYVEGPQAGVDVWVTGAVLSFDDAAAWRAGQSERIKQVRWKEGGREEGWEEEQERV